MKKPDDEETVITGSGYRLEDYYLNIEYIELAAEGDEWRGGETTDISEAIELITISGESEERRRHTRYAHPEGYYMNLMQKGQAKATFGYIVDISKGGVRFAIHEGHLGAGETVAMEIVNDQDKSNIHVVGKVIRVRDRDDWLREVAVEFKSPGLIAQKFIQRTMACGQLMTDQRWLGSSGRKKKS